MLPVCVVDCAFLLYSRLQPFVYVSQSLPLQPSNTPNQWIATPKVVKKCCSLLFIARFSSLTNATLACASQDLFPRQLCYRKSTGNDTKSGCVHCRSLPFIAPHKTMNLLNKGRTTPLPPRNNCPRKEQVHMQGQRPSTAHNVGLTRGHREPSCSSPVLFIVHVSSSHLFNPLSTHLKLLSSLALLHKSTYKKNKNGRR